MIKYITNKQVDLAKFNDLENFNSIGEAIWNLILSIYQFKWDTFIANKNSNILRQKILSKFTPKVLPISNKSHKSLDKPTPVSIKKIPPFIPTKLQKKVNQISCYFKNIKPVNISKLTQRSYIQVFKQTTNISKVIKIKDTFLAFGTKKINQIQNIVNGNPKPKLCIQIMTKELSRKQIIIPMSSNNIKKFMKTVCFMSLILIDH